MLFGFIYTICPAAPNGSNHRMKTGMAISPLLIALMKYSSVMVSPVQRNKAVYSDSFWKIPPIYFRMEAMQKLFFCSGRIDRR